MMIEFTRDDVRFNYRIAGASILDGRILLQQAIGEDFWVLPGGRAELLESAAETLAREMKEELDVEIQIDRLLWIVENFFEYSKYRYHELSFIFLMRFPADSPLYRVNDSIQGVEGTAPAIFRWFPLGELENVPLYPGFLCGQLLSLPESAEHIVHHDRPQPILDATD
jgi:ADP-ribose pyrophosphatase YjhB (NUDIX family)